MKKLSFLSILASLFLIVSCTSFRLESGKYTMTLQLKDQDQEMPKTVMVTTEGKQVILKTEDNEEPLIGNLSGNSLKITGKVNSDEVEFIGTLVMDNSVEGKAIQKTKGEVKFDATFTLIKEIN